MYILLQNKVLTIAEFLRNLSGISQPDSSTSATPNTSEYSYFLLQSSYDLINAFVHYYVQNDLLLQYVDGLDSSQSQHHLQYTQ